MLKTGSLGGVENFSGTQLRYRKTLFFHLTNNFICREASTDAIDDVVGAILSDR